MVKEVKYENQQWGEPISGERKSTNGNYTGQRLGTPMQDAQDKVGMNDNAYWVEENTVRLGTLTQDEPASIPNVAGAMAAETADVKKGK